MKAFSLVTLVERDQSLERWSELSAQLLCRHDLHVLLVEHGKRCPRCAKIPGRPRKEPVGDCPLLPARLLQGDKACWKASDPAEQAGRRKRKASE